MRNLKILRDEDIFLDQYIKKIYPGVVISESKGSVQFDVNRLSSLVDPVRRRILRYAVESMAGEEAVALSFKHVEDSISLLDSGRDGEIHLPGGLIAKRERDSFGVYLKADVVTHTPPYAYPVAIPGDTVVPEAGITISAAILEGSPDEKEGVEHGRYKACFDMGKFSLPLIIRNRIAGDFFCPKGMNGRRKKIKEYFIDLKIGRGERDRIPILTSPEGLLWIIGYRTDERFRVTSVTEKILQVVAAGFSPR